ncbi:MAG: B-box zinc finger protein [bacterium]
MNELACVTCKQRICPHCALFGGHKGHEVKEEKEA